MVRVGQERLRHALEQAQLDLDRRRADGQSGAVGDAKDVRVDGQRRVAEGVVEDDVGGLAADPGKRLERLARARHLPAVLLDQDAAGRVQILRLGAKQADRADRVLERRQARGPASSAASARRAKSARVALFTPRSVACADSSTAASNSKMLA